MLKVEARLTPMKLSDYLIILAHKMLCIKLLTAQHLSPLNLRLILIIVEIDKWEEVCKTMEEILVLGEGIRI